MPVTDLVIGLGSRPGASERAVREVVAELLARHGLVTFSVLAYATLDSRAAEPGLRAATAGAELLGYPARVLAAVEVPTPNRRVAHAVGTASVAEAAALHAARCLAGAAGTAELVARKLVGAGVTAAAARIRS